MSDPDAAARCIFPADMRQLHDFQKLTLVVARAVHGKGATGIAHIAETFAVAQPHMDTGHRNNRHRLNRETYSCCGSAARGHRAEDQEALRSEHLLWLSCAGTQGKGAAGISHVHLLWPSRAGTQGTGTADIKQFRHVFESSREQLTGQELTFLPGDAC